MMTGFSPLMRQILAIGILLLFVLFVIEFLIFPIKDAVQSSRSLLEDSRFELARLQNTANRPEPSKGQNIEAVSLLTAKDETAAQDIFQNRLRALALKNSLEITISFQEQADTAIGLLSATISLSGEEESIISFISDLENNPTLIRLINWNINYQADNARKLQMNARALVSWRQE